MQKTKFILNVGIENISVIEASGDELENIMESPEDEGVFGFSHTFPESAAYYNSCLSPKSQATTSLHEILHCVDGIYELGLTETHVRILEQSLCQILQNKAYAKWLCENITKH